MRAFQTNSLFALHKREIMILKEIADISEISTVHNKTIQSRVKLRKHVGLTKS